MKPGRPPSLSIALQEAINRFQSTLLAIKKLDDALAAINRATSAFKAALDLRHSGVVRQLIAGVRIRAVAVSHDTSVAMLEKTYGRCIGDHSDVLVRRALLQMEQPVGADVVPPARGRREMTASDESGSWLLLSAVYHCVRARMQTDRAAQIAIWEAHRGGRLRMRAELREHKARPDLRLRSDLRLAPGEKPPTIQPNPGEEPPTIQPKITPDYPILPTDAFEDWDWEYSRAIRRDKKSRALFEYVNIVVNREDMLACWPELTEPAAATTAVDPSILKKPKDMGPRVWLAVQAIDALEREDHVDPATIPQDDLLVRLRRRMPEGSKPGVRVSVGKRTMQKALAYREMREGTK